VVLYCRHGEQWRWCCIVNAESSGGGVVDTHVYQIPTITHISTYNEILRTDDATNKKCTLSRSATST